MVGGLLDDSATRQLMEACAVSPILAISLGWSYRASSEIRSLVTPLRKARCEAELLILGRDELARLDIDTEDLIRTSFSVPRWHWRHLQISHRDLSSKAGPRWG